MRLPTIASVVLLGSLSGCGSDESGPPPIDPPLECPVPEVALPDGTCMRPGIAEGDCAPGFEHDGEYACEPILPADPCQPGQMALPGETACRPLMTCGDGPWGDIPTDGTTVYVDTAYAGGNSDGSSAHPFTTINEAVAAAAAGALVAVAEGQYHEDVRWGNKALRLWGRCPALVEVVGLGVEYGAIKLGDDAHDSEVRGLAVTGARGGVFISNSRDVILDGLWVHDTAFRGIEVQNNGVRSTVTVTNVLVEQAHNVGMYLSASEVIVDATVVRGTQSDADTGVSGRGINIQRYCHLDVCDEDSRGTVTITGTVIEDNHDAGLRVSGSEVTVDGTVVRGTLARQLDLRFGSGVEVQVSCVEGVCDPTSPAAATIRGTFIDGNHDAGLRILGSQASVERTVVRGTLPQPGDQRFGRGVEVHLPCSVGACGDVPRSNVTLRRSLVEHNHEHGLRIAGAEAIVEDVVVRHTLPDLGDQSNGSGITVQVHCSDDYCDPTTRSVATIVGTLVEENCQAGIVAAESDLSLARTVVRNTSEDTNGLYGDGIVAVGDLSPTTLTISATFVRQSARGGIVSFGSLVSLQSTRVVCAALELNGEPHGGNNFSFLDEGDNGCGCPTANGACQVLSVGLEPPSASTSH